MGVDIPLARVQRLTEIRWERDKRFLPLDNAWMRAIGTQDNATAVATEATRRQLRDVPQIAAVKLGVCTTPDAIAAYEPVWPV